MKIHVELGSRKRKELAQVLAEVFGATPVYKGSPTYAYEAGRALIDRQGVIILKKASRFDKSAVERMMGALNDHGFRPQLVDEGDTKPIEPDKLTIQVPLEGFDAHSIENLRLLVASKATLIKKALGVCDLAIRKTNTTIDFPWFDRIPSPEGTAVYTQFITALCEMAKRQQRIVAVEKPTDNEKFTFRLFLVRLGMKGEEFANARRILLRDLTGNGSWKDVEGRSTRPKTVLPVAPEAEVLQPEPVSDADSAVQVEATEEVTSGKRKFSFGTMLRRLKGLGCV